MEQNRIALLRPGQMGFAVGRVLAEAGHWVFWASEGRLIMTQERAAVEGLVDTSTVGDAVAQSEVVLSICPPQAAEVVSEVAACRSTLNYA